jgi:ribonuclease HI
MHRKIFINITKTLQPAVFSIVQCDGSFKSGMGRTAVLFEQHRRVSYPIRMESSTEAEWKAVHNALLFGLEHNLTDIGIENDNLGVINTFLNDIIPKREYARYYKWKIRKDAEQTEWTGVRWIPRERNRADDLFMKH